MDRNEYHLPEKVRGELGIIKLYPVLGLGAAFVLIAISPHDYLIGILLILGSLFLIAFINRIIAGVIHSIIVDSLGIEGISTRKKSHTKWNEIYDVVFSDYSRYLKLKLKGGTSITIDYRFDKIDDLVMLLAKYTSLSRKILFEMDKKRISERG